MNAAAARDHSAREKLELTGCVTGAFVACDPASLVSTRRREVRLTWEGIAGDKHAGLTKLAATRERYYPWGTEIRNNRQISVVSAEELTAIAAALEVEYVLPEWLGVNLLVEGVPRLSLLPPTTRLVFPTGAVMLVHGENMPCIYPGEVIQEHHPHVAPGHFPRVAIHKRGVVGCVECPGLIREGDTVRVQVPEQRLYDPAEGS